MNSTIWIIIYCICTYIIAGFLIYYGIKKAKEKLAKNQIVDVMVTQLLTSKKNDWKKPSVILPIALLGLAFIPIALPIYVPFFIYGKIAGEVKKAQIRKFIITGEQLFWQALERIDKEGFSDDTVKTYFKEQESPYADMEGYSNLEMWVRNNLTHIKSEEPTNLQKWFIANEIKNPDSMCAILTIAIYRKLKLVDIDLKGLIAEQKESAEGGMGMLGL